MEERSKAYLQELAIWKNMALNFARQKRQFQHADDFSQFVALQFVARYPKRFFMKHIWADYWREIEGRHRSENYETRRKILKAAEIKEHHSKSGARQEEQLLAHDELKFLKKELRRNAKVSKEYKSRLIAVVMLYYYWDFKFHEIGDIFDVSESRAKQLHDEALNFIV